MKRLLIALTAIMIMAVTCEAQGFGRRNHFRNVYTNVETLALQNAPTPFPTENGDYLVELPKESKLVIAFNTNKTKAIVLDNGYMFGRRMEFNVKDDEARLVLFFKDEHVYCGYIYDKKTKAGKYFEAINQTEKDKLTERLPFLKRMPTFTIE